MVQGKAPLHQTTDPGDLHAQIQQMIAAAQGMAPMPPPQPQMAAPGGAPAPQGQPMQGGPPQMGGSPQNAQRAMMAQAIRGG